MTVKILTLVEIVDRYKKSGVGFPAPLIEVKMNYAVE